MGYQAVRNASFRHSHVPAVTAVGLPFLRDRVTASLPWIAGIRICRPFKGSQLPFHSVVQNRLGILDFGPRQ